METAAPMDVRKVNCLCKYANVYVISTIVNITENQLTDSVTSGIVQLRQRQQESQSA